MDKMFDPPLPNIPLSTELEYQTPALHEETQSMHAENNIDESSDSTGNLIDQPLQSSNETPPTISTTCLLGTAPQSMMLSFLPSLRNADRIARQMTDSLGANENVRRKPPPLLPPWEREPQQAAEGVTGAIAPMRWKGRQVPDGEGDVWAPEAVEGVTVAVAPPPSSPLPVPQPEPVEDRDEGMVVAEDNDSPPPIENMPDAMEGVEVVAPLPLEPVAVQEGGDDVAVGEIAPAGQAVGEIAPAGQAVGDFACEVCGARYPTEKAMFGHLRCHMNRGWRGAFSMEEFAEYQEHLVKPEEEQLREIEAEERAAAGERVVLNVDLNAEAAPEEEFILPDLNLPPPDED
nr:protein VASP homolog [Ipomoea batatas]